jgi:hypothetical protein
MSICRLAGALAIAVMITMITSSAYSEPTSGSVTISQLRPYIGGTLVYVYLNGAGPCGQQSGAYGIYTIDLSSPAGKAAYAAALVAVATGKQVQLEAIAGACGSPYPGLQSIYIGS